MTWKGTRADLARVPIRLEVRWQIVSKSIVAGVNRYVGEVIELSDDACRKSATKHRCIEYRMSSQIVLQTMSGGLASRASALFLVLPEFEPWHA